MMSKTKTMSLALLLAYRALAAPVDNVQQNEVQSVIDALKVQLKDADVPSSVTDNIEASLRLNGALDAENIEALNVKILSMNNSASFDAESLAVETMGYLRAEGAFEESDENKVQENVVSLSNGLISRVLGQGVAELMDCPMHERMCGGCVIL